MRIQYTIPGWEPTTQTPRTASGGAPVAFDPGVDRPAEVDAPGFRELLDLDRPQPGDVFIGPPPRPASLSYSDAVEDRRVWHSLLARHCDARQANPAAGQMLDLLSQLQDLEDAVAARTLAGAKL